MKNLTKASVVLAGLALSSAATAQVENEIGSLASSGSVTATTDGTGCSVISRNVSITLSPNTSMAWMCSPDYNQIKLMACNSAGSRTPATIACTFTVDNTVTTTHPDDTNLYGYFENDECTDDFDNSTGAQIYIDIVGGRYYSVTSAGGTISESGGSATDRCDTDTLEAGIVPTS